MISYLSLFPVLILLLACAVLIILKLVRPEFPYTWLIASSGALLSWLLVLLSRSNIPQSISFFSWGTDQLTPYTLELLLDQYSWPYAFTLATLVLSVILTDVIRPDNGNWFVWPVNLLIGALGILAVESGNPYTLLIAWTAIDLAEVIIFLRQHYQNSQRNKTITAIAARVAGTFLLVWAILYTLNSGVRLDFSLMPTQTSVLLILSAVLRMGVFPLNHPILQDTQLHRTLGTTTRLVSTAAGLILLSRTAIVGVQTLLTPYMMAITGLVAVLAAFVWIVSRDEIQGQSYWILGVGAFSVASAIRAQPLASLAWGELLILSGSLLFLVSTRNRILYSILLVAGLSITTLPYTSGWNGVLLYLPYWGAPLLLFLIAQSFLLAGYLRHALRPEPPLSGLVRWVWLIYPWGLALLPASYYIIGWFGWQVELSLVSVLPGFLVSLMTIIWVTIYYQIKRRPVILQYVRGVRDRISNIFPSRWIFPLIGRAYLSLGRSLSFFVTVLEGDGGVLWALFFLVLFIAILTQLRIGG